MIKNIAFKRIIITTLSLLILFIVYLFPTNTKEYQDNISYINSIKSPVYLVDKNNYVSRVSIINQGKTLNEKIKNTIYTLIIDNPNTIYLPNGFKPIIPKNTKIIDLNIQDKLLKINFSKELLNISLENEEKMIEAIIYTLTEFEEINQIMIFVEGNRLLKLPHSKTILPIVFDKNYGINKTYDVTSFKAINKTITYYIASTEDLVYYIPVTTINNDSTEKIQIIIKNLKTSPINQTNLTSYLASAANLSNYEILENSINLSFNNNLISNIQDSQMLEEVKYSIFLSARDTYNIKAVVFEMPNLPLSIVY